jgi:RNA polymerase sigma factor (sigma-70 family)
MQTALAERTEAIGGPSDHQLVSRVRCGDDRAFELLFQRYQRRVAGYVFGMVKDYGRAEDITQEVFVSALRRMRQTERPIAFKPWIFEIAKNACIDAYRRSRRAEEVSYDADERLSPADAGKLVARDPTPDAMVDVKQELDHLCGAFGGLTDAHHQILVLRELEGRSYKDIGEAMGLSRPAVESTLFRARKRLSEEYDDLASGARCVRVQAIIAAAGGSDARLGLRDQRRLARHISHCQPCRRMAMRAGLEVPQPASGRFARKLAGWLPLPGFLRLRKGATNADDHATAAGGWLSHAPALADGLQGPWSKAIAGLAALAVAGAGVGVTNSALGEKRDERGTGALSGAAAKSERKGAQPASSAAPGGGSAAARAGRGGGSDRVSSSATGGRRHVGTGATQTGAKGGSNPSGGGGSGSGSGDGGGGGGAGGLNLPASAPSTPVDNTVNAAGDTAQQTIDDAANTVNNAAGNVQQVVDDPANAVPQVQPTVDQVVQDAGQTVDGAVDGATDTVGGVLNP